MKQVRFEFEREGPEVLISVRAKPVGDAHARAQHATIKIAFVDLQQLFDAACRLRYGRKADPAHVTLSAELFGDLRETP